MTDKVLVRYITDTQTLGLDRVYKLKEEAKEVLQTLTKRGTIDLHSDDFIKAVNDIDKHFEPYRYCIVAIGSAIGGGRLQPISELKKRVERHMRKFEKVIFCFFIRASKSVVGDTEEACSEEVVHNLLKEFPLSTYYHLKYIEEGIYVSDAKLRAFESLKQCTHASVTAMTDKDPSWISSYTMTLDTMEVIQKYEERIEATCKTLLDDDSLQMTIENSLATEVTESKLKHICANIKLEGEPEGRIHRSIYHYQQQILEETMQILATRIVKSIFKSAFVVEHEAGSSTNLTLVPSRHWNTKERVKEHLLIIKPTVMSSYELWSMVFGITLEKLKNDLAISIKTAIHSKQRDITRKLGQIFKDEIETTKDVMVYCSESLKNIAQELQNEALRMDITDISEDDFKSFRQCQEKIENLSLPQDAIIHCGKIAMKDTKGHKVCICIRTRHDLDLPKSLGDNIVVDFKTFKSAAEQTQKLLRKSKEKFKRSIDTHRIMEIIKRNGPAIMQMHSNVCTISASDVKLNDDGETVETSDTGYIELYCEGVGVVPFGERKFPKTIGPYDVVVREGNWQLGALPKLPLGCKIGLEGRHFTGSVGPFIQTSFQGFITCCHVICGEQNMLQNNLSLPTYNVLQHTDFGNPNVTIPVRRCGTVDEMFGIVNKRVVDLASISLYQCNLESPNIEVGISEVKYGNEVFKLGCKTGLTRGLLVFDGAIARQQIHGRYFIFEDLIQIQNHPDNPGNVIFFAPGDSGSAAYRVTVRSGQRQVLQLMGICNAFMAGSSISYAIPIGLVERTFRLRKSDFLRSEIDLINDVEM